jgi:geranylgeranylglycerol-phosphate geranylgeranyltransferase
MKANRIGAFLRLVRVEHSIMLIIAVLAAELIVGGLPTPGILALSLITPAFISAGAFAINDYYDVDSDLFNKRHDRPLVSGVIGRRTAKNVAIACFVIGILASVPLGAAVLFVALVFAMLSFLYSYWLKDTFLLGNAYIAFSMAIPFIYGSVVVSGGVPVVIVLIAFVVFLSGLGREIHGMVRDRAGDKSGRKTHNIVEKIGVKDSLSFAFIFYFEAIAISIYLFLYYFPFKFNLVYLILTTVANLLLFYVAVVAMMRPGDARFIRASRNISLAAMTIALFGYLLSSLLYVPLVL